MALTRRLPNSDGGRKLALDKGKGKKDNTAAPAIVFSANTVTRLDFLQPLFFQRMKDRDDALVAQTLGTAKKESDKIIVKTLISDFIQTFNAGVRRGIFPKEHRAFYHLDVNSDSVPPMGSDDAVIEMGQWLIDGDPRRITAGGAPMAMPTIAEVSAKYTIFMNSYHALSTLKDAYDTAQEAVQALRPEADALILRMWNEAETAYDNESMESKRRNAREWGVVYVSTTKTNITGTVRDAASGTPLVGVNVTLVETEHTVQTDDGGNYLLDTTFVGTGTMEFAFEGYVTQNISVEVPEGGAVELNAKLVKV